MYQRGWKLLLLGAVASVYSTSALGTTYNLKDTPECTLEEAIQAVTTQKTVGACEAGTGNDRILLVQNKTYELKEQLVLGGGTTFVEEEVESEDEDDEPEVIEVEKPIRNITLRIETAAEPGQRNEDRETATIKAATGDRVFWIHGSNTLSLEHIRLEGGDVTEKPLVVEWTQKEQSSDNEDDDTTTYTYSLNRFGEAPFGGVAFVEGTLTTRTHVEIEGGKARKGGAIYVNGSGLNLGNAKITTGMAADDSETPEIAVCHVLTQEFPQSGPSCDGIDDDIAIEAPEDWQPEYKEEYANVFSGGALHLQKGDLSLTQTWFEQNKAGRGGAIATDPFYGGNITADGAYFTSNIASEVADDENAGAGGAIFIAGAEEKQPRANIDMVNTLMHDNHAQQGGAALHVSNVADTSKIWLNNVTIFKNTVEGAGAGAWFAEPLNDAIFINSVVLANESGAYKRANKSDFPNAKISGCWTVGESAEPQPLYCYEFQPSGDPDNKKYEADEFLYDDEEPWLRLSDSDSLDYIGRKGKEWQTLADAGVAADAAEQWLEAWDEEPPTFYDSSIKAKNENGMWTVSKDVDPLFTLKEGVSGTEINPSGLYSLEQILVFNNGSNSSPNWELVKVAETSDNAVESLTEQLSVRELKQKYAQTNSSSEEKLVWKSGTIEIGEPNSEPVYFDENGNLYGKKNDSSKETLYLAANRSLTTSSSPQDGEERALNNINEISYVNQFIENPDTFVYRSYLWHGNTVPEGEIVLDKKEQLALLRGTTSEGVGACEEDNCEAIQPKTNLEECDDNSCEGKRWLGLPYFTVNFDAPNEDKNDEFGKPFSLLASGAPYVGSSDANVCESKDMRGFTRQDRCDAGAVDFQRALGEKDTFYITVGGKDTFDVLKNDLGDTDVDCSRVDGFDPNDKDTYDSCLKVVIKSTRFEVTTTTVVNEKGYPQIAYDSGSGFHGHDYFEYRVSKDAFPPNTTLGANDVGARVAVVSEPGTGIKSESLDQIGSAHLAWLLGLLGLGAARRGNTKRYALALGALALSAFPAAHAAEVKVSNNEDYFEEKSTQYPVDVCTLRAAIASTEAPPTNTACSQGSGGVSRDVILLPAGEFVLWDTLKVNQNNPIEIRGEGPDKTTITMRDEDDFCARLFETESALTLSNLTLEGGCVQSDSEDRGGAALYAYGLTPPSVAMSNVHVKGNKAEGANGGAVFLAYRADNKAEATFDKVFFEGNKAANGGAIYVDAIGDSSRNIINITNSTFTKNKATASGNAIATASGKNVRINIINSLFFDNKNNDQAAVDLSNHRGSTFVLNSTFIGNKDAFKFDVEPARFALHNSVVSDGIEGTLSVSRNLQAGYNLLDSGLECSGSGGSSEFCARKADNNEFLDASKIKDLHEEKLSILCAEKDNEEGCLEGERWFVPYLPVKERHLADGNASEEIDTCEPPAEDEGGSYQGPDKVCKIIERGNPAPLQTGVSTPTNCRTTDMRGRTRAAGGQCDRGAFEVQTNTAMPDIGNNSSRKSRTALLNVLRNDITGDDTKGSEMYIRPGTLRVHEIEDEEINGKDVNGEPVVVDVDEVKANLEKHFGDKNEKLAKFFKKGGNTLGALHVVRAAWDYKGKYKKPVPQYYDDITIINADGDEIEQFSQVLNENSSNYNPNLQCVKEDGTFQEGVDEDEECLVFYEAPKNYLCTDLPFEDYFAYSVESWEVDSWKEVPETDANGKELKDGSGQVIMVKEPEFAEDAMTKLFTGYVQVTIDNIPPIVPREGIKYRIDPGGKITIDLKENGVKPIEGGVDEERPIKIESLTLEKEPQFALYNRRTHEVLGTGLFLDKENLTVTYHHGDVTKTFADTFSVKVTDSCGASSIVPIRIEFHGADDAGGSTPWALTLLLVAGGAVRRRRMKAKAA